jgi:hypothetical protein
MGYKPLMKLHLLVAALAGTLAACASKAPAQSASGRGLTLSDDAPPSNFERLGELSVKSGEGCGVLGKSGSREDAEARLQVEARRLGASYVQVTSSESPRPNHQCLEHEYKLSGIAYRAPAPIPPATATSTAPPTSPPP